MRKCTEMTDLGPPLMRMDFRLQSHRLHPLLEPEHILHVIQRRWPILQPQRGAHRSLGKGHATGCLMGDFHALAISSEQHGVVTDHIASAYGGETDGFALSGT